MELSDDQLERYARHIVLKEIGGAGQARLLASRAVVIGAGGLGAPALLYLAAAGVGEIVVVDDDAVALSNLQRQVIHGVSDIGAPKTASAAASLRGLNPDIRVIEERRRLTAENGREILARAHVALDGSDSFETRFASAEAAAALKVPLVGGAIGQFDGQLALWAPWAALDAPCYRCLVPEAPPAGTVLTCASGGVLGAMAGVMGAMMAVEAVKALLNLGAPLIGRLLLYDALGAEVRVMSLKRRPDCPLCSDLPREG